MGDYRTDSGMVQIFLFSAGGLRCALPLAGIQSVIQMMAMNPVAAASPGMAGTVNLHGRIIPVYSVGELFGSARKPPSLSDMLLIAQAGGDTVAVWIDETRGVEELELPPAPKIVGGDGHLPPYFIITGKGIVFIADLAGFLLHPPDTAALKAIGELRKTAGLSPRTEPEGEGTDAGQVRAVLYERAAKMLPAKPGTTLAEMTEVLRFQLTYRQYAIDMNYVREVILTGEITPVPGTPDFISGICAVRGQIISLVDLRALLQIPEKGLTDLNRVIVITDGKITFGILADTISGVKTIALDQVQPPRPDDMPGSNRYLKGVLGRDLFVLDAKAILSDPGIIVDDA
jgi:purine-binding chemotaxis protein CheW